MTVPAPSSTEAGPRTSRWPLHLVWLAPLAFLGVFYFYPMASILGLSLSRSPQGPLGGFVNFFTSAGELGVLGFTMWQAVLSTLLTLIVGLPGAYVLARYRFRGKALLRALTGIPFVLPTLVVAAAFNALLGPSGWINVALMAALHLSAPPVAFNHTLFAILAAHVFYNTTIVLRMVGDFWSHIDPRLTAAARVLGANRWQALRRVGLPLLLPAIAAASLLVFLFDFTSFGVILVLGGPRLATLEVEIYNQTVNLFNLPLAAALSIVQLAATLAMTVVYTGLAARVSRPLPLKARRVTERPALSRRSRVAVAAVVGLLLLILTTPMLALAARSFARIGPQRRQAASPALTLDYYRLLNQDSQDSLFYVPPMDAVWNSLTYAGATVVLALALGLPAAWSLAYNTRSRLNRWLDPLLMLPLGTSAVTLGFGFIIALDAPPLDLRASPILVPIGHTLVAFPFVVRSLTPALRSIQPRLRQAAAMLGAGPRKVFRSIDLPLVGRAVMVAAAFAFSISLGEFGATSLIARPEHPTVPILIYRFLSRPGTLNFGQAMALSTLLMLVTGGGMLAIERMRIADVGEF
jgi:thiamine transport system permease protein